MTQAPLISIVDDDDSLRLALVGLVRSLGHRAEGFASAEDFLAWPSRRDSACIITDIHMPRMSGVDLLHRLARENAAAPVIMITARTDESVKAQALASGALCVLHKPFAAEALISCLERALASETRPR